MISYYELLGIIELLGMIKNGDVPKKLEVKLHGVNYSRIYQAEYDGDDFNCYRIGKQELVDDNYHAYLSDCFLESGMFDKCIKILDDGKEI